MTLEAGGGDVVNTQCRSEILLYDVGQRFYAILHLSIFGVHGLFGLY